MWHAYSGLSGGRYRRYLSLREGSETEPEWPALYAEIIHLRGERDWGLKIVDTPFRPGAAIDTLIPAPARLVQVPRRFVNLSKEKLNE